MLNWILKGGVLAFIRIGEQIEAPPNQSEVVFFPMDQILLLQEGTPQTPVFSLFPQLTSFCLFPVPFLSSAALFSLCKDNMLWLSQHLLGPTVLANNVGPKLIFSSLRAHNYWNSKNRDSDDDVVMSDWCRKGELARRRADSSIREPFTFAHTVQLYIGQVTLHCSPITLLHCSYCLVIHWSGFITLFNPYIALH